MEIHEILRTLHTDAPLQSRLETTLLQLTALLGAERGCVMVTRAGREMVLFAGDDELNLKFPFSRSVVSEAMVGNTGLVAFDQGSAEGDDISSMAMHGVRTALCVPLIGPNREDFGVIYFDTRVSNEAFTKTQLKEVTQVAEEISKLLQA